MLHGEYELPGTRCIAGSKGGHLLSHLDVPAGAGPVMKDESGESRCTTDQGFGVMAFIKNSWE